MSKKSPDSKSPFRKNRPRPIRKKKKRCEHGRQKGRCKDCGTGYCEHKRLKGQCKDCFTIYCSHGRRKRRCRKCKT